MKYTFLQKAMTSIAAAAGTALLLGSHTAQAVYPDHPIKIVVPYNAGGGTDVLSRAVAAGLGNVLKTTVIVDNRPGASGMIGSDLVARAAPDGYTLVMTAADTHTINPHVYPKISYDARKDFVAVAQVGYLPYALIVSPKLGVSTVKEYIALAKKSPGKLTYASWGVGSSSHVAMEMLNVGQALDVLHVPFTGAAPAMTAIMGGQVDALFVPLSLAKPNADAGKVKLLGLAAPKRFGGAPDVPTLTEQGVNVIAAPWIGILAPAGTPQKVLDTLSNAVAQAVKTDKVIKALTVGGLEINVRNSKDFASFLIEDYTLWGDTVKAANIRAE
ncbi:tripartite tricarboxylate transporter substrate binding protein [Candidimonas sp. SYP-B2681]|uniref:Bug family tripartite tricarboxylate transporter substrate binding protein n=1 Tax=Candidimonas sp. SYP-B2681 TaxID=2497686 RepID=UPI000F883109|nr:tripartite tricarboxylate transporter substrate binding protein [Candidimonas sp. SYP-B2681]RTZ47833.1 tripartite tricarboxylate transporter substrate binding protein [Candidimonas sp. SYP-B2681]